jgi:hypothetical protein
MQKVYSQMNKMILNENETIFHGFNAMFILANFGQTANIFAILRHIHFGPLSQHEPPIRQNCTRSPWRGQAVLSCSRIHI